MKHPRRDLVVGCRTPQTYKYWLPLAQVPTAWALLREAYGPLRTNEAFGTQELHTPSLIMRSTRIGNPLTVFRTRSCSEADLERFHQLIDFHESRAAS